MDIKEKDCFSCAMYTHGMGCNLDVSVCPDCDEYSMWTAKPKEMKTDKQIVMKILSCYADDVKGIDFKHIPDMKFNSVANDIINELRAKLPSDKEIRATYFKTIDELNEWFGTGEYVDILSMNYDSTQLVHWVYYQYKQSLQEPKED